MFVSYAQNFEDVMLWRALKGVENGCYIDVGAQHPVSDSVSKAFYDLGWRGIHIEPVPEFAQLLKQNRPDESVFQVALGATAGTAKLFNIEGTGLSTVVESVASRHATNDGFVIHELSVPRLTLDMIFETLPEGQAVHWLKVDVEGAELAVLDGWSRRKYRPWVVVIEATRPGSTTENFAEWEDRLTSGMYSHVYSDGLNRFYLAAEHSAALGPSFRYPPNVFDGVSLSGLAHAPWTTLVASRAVETARDLQSSLESELLTSRQSVGHLQESIDTLRQQHTTDIASVQQALATASAERFALERSLRKDLQVAQDDSVRWSSLVAMREKAHGEILSEHFSTFHSSLQSALNRAESFAQQAADEQKGRLALMQDVARLGAQLEALAGERARQSEAFSIRERESLRKAAHQMSEISAFAIDIERLSLALDSSNAEISQLQQRLIASNDECEQRISSVCAERDESNAEVVQLKNSRDESGAKLSELVESAQAQCARLTESITALRTTHAEELIAVRRVAADSEARWQMTDQQVQVVRHDLRQQHMAVAYWTSIAAKHEWYALGMQSSWSWRLTSPLRWTGAVVLQIVTSLRALFGNIAAIAGRFPVGMLVLAVRWIRRHPLQQRWLLSWLNRTPGLRSRMLEFASAVPFPSSVHPQLLAAASQSALGLSLDRSLEQDNAPTPLPAADRASPPELVALHHEFARTRAVTDLGEFSRALQSWQLGHRVNS